MTPEKIRYEGLEEDLASFGPAGHVRNWVPDKDWALGPGPQGLREAHGAPKIGPRVPEMGENIRHQDPPRLEEHS